MTLGSQLIKKLQDSKYYTAAFKYDVAQKIESIDDLMSLVLFCRSQKLVVQDELSSIQDLARGIIATKYQKVQRLLNIFVPITIICFLILSVEPALKGDILNILMTLITPGLAAFATYIALPNAIKKMAAQGYGVHTDPEDPPEIKI